MRPTPELTYEYRLARERALEAARERRAAAVAAIPRLGEIADERRETAYSLGLAALSGEQSDAKALIAALDAEEARLLSTHGLPADYLRPKFRCEACQDTGYTGDTERRLCPCMIRRLNELRYSASGVNASEVFSAFRTDIFPSDKQRRIATKAMELCRAYAESFPKNEVHDILLMGGTGLGKSFLLNAIAARVSERGHTALLLSAYSLINGSLEAIRQHAEPPDLLSPSLLIIDDLGTEPMINTVTRETLFSMLNERQRAGRATAFATNLSFGDIQESYGDRFFSRLVSPRMTMVLRLEGEDLRLSK